MNEYSTPEKFLLYLNNETGVTDSVMVRHAIESDPLVADEFLEIASFCMALDQVFMKPDPAVVESILLYSVATSSAEIH